jgi:hypothetical protein
MDISKITSNEPFMRIASILIIAFIVLYILRKLYQKTGTNQKFILSAPLQGSSTRTIKSSKLPRPLNTNEFTYSMWIYINGVNTAQKTLTHLMHIGNPDLSVVSPGIWLKPGSNDLNVRFNLIKNKNNQLANNIKDCGIENLPIKRWFNLSIVVNQEAIELYVDGHLVKTCVASGLPNLNQGDLFLCKNKDFDGVLSKLSFTSLALSANDIQTIYMKGPNDDSNIKSLLMSPFSYFV